MLTSGQVLPTIVAKNRKGLLQMKMLIAKCGLLTIRQRFETHGIRSPMWLLSGENYFPKFTWTLYWLMLCVR
jgi:hypothetical protein